MSKIPFIYLPFVAPMMPPLSIPVLTAFLEKNNIETESYDLNIELYQYLLRKECVEKGYELINEKYKQIDFSEKLKKMDKSTIDLLSMRLKSDDILSNLNSAVRKFSLEDDITSYKELFKYSKVISGALEMSTLNLAYLDNKNPMNFTFNINYSKVDNIFSHSSWSNVSSWMLDRIYSICKEKQYVCFSVCYDSQIHFLSWVVKKVKEKFPSIKIIVGGPVISGIIKKSTLSFNKDYLKENKDYIDVAVLGDGEYPLLDYFNGENNKSIYYSPFNIEKVENDDRNPPILTPKFEDLPLNSYITPNLTLPLISARGCYWGRCKFCTHSIGYNRYLKYSDNDVINSMEEIINKFGVKNFYFVDECMAPVTAAKISDWVKNEYPEVRWMTDMRFENALLDEQYIKNLYEGGCRYIAFGMESANDRVLKCMNKGTSREKIEKIVDNCHKYNINITTMFFFGFPTETFEEANDTFSYVINNIEKIGGIGMGPFSLVPGSYVYDNYTEFSITYVDESGNYTITQGMNKEQVYNFYSKCRDYVASNFYRGHSFYHRTYYLIELDEKDKSKYPISICSYEKLKNNRRDEWINRRGKIRLNKDICLEKIPAIKNGKQIYLTAVLDFSAITEKIYFIEENTFKQILLLCNGEEHNLEDTYIEQLFMGGIIKYE